MRQRKVQCVLPVGIYHAGCTSLYFCWYYIAYLVLDFYIVCCDRHWFLFTCSLFRCRGWNDFRACNINTKCSIFATCLYTRYISTLVLGGKPATTEVVTRKLERLLSGKLEDSNNMPATMSCVRYVWFLCKSDLELQILVRLPSPISFLQIESGFLCETGSVDGDRSFVCLLVRVTQQYSSTRD